MAAPQQHKLTNTSCTLAASPAVFSSTGETYGGGHSATCGDVYSRLSGASVRDVQGVVVPSGAVVPHHLLPRPASRRARPCSLCGTAALRSQFALVPNSPVGPLEQPVVLLHRLEDGLPEGDVNSLRAYGTIRLLPVHGPCGKTNAAAEDSRKEHDGNTNEGSPNHAMGRSALVYKGYKRGSIKKRPEFIAWSGHGRPDGNSSLTKETNVNNSDPDDHETCKNKAEFSEVTVKCAADVKNANVSSGNSHCTSTQTYTPVRGNAKAGRGRVEGGGLSAPARKDNTSTSLQQNLPPPPSYDTASADQSCQPCSRVLPLKHSPPLPSPAETLESSTSSSPVPSVTRCSSPSAVTDTNSTPSSQPHENNCQSSPPPADLQAPSSPYTPMSVVFSPILPQSSPLPTTTLSSSASPQPLDSPPSPPPISLPDSPPSPPSPFSPPFPCSPLNSDREALHSACSVDTRELPSSSPYSPRTLPSLPASPTSLPSRSESPPSPAPSLEFLPESPATSVQDCADGEDLLLLPDTRLPGDYSRTAVYAAQVESSSKSNPDPAWSGSAYPLVVPSSHHVLKSPMNDDEEPSSKGFVEHQVVTQVNMPTVSPINRIQSAQVQPPEDVRVATQEDGTENQVDSGPTTSGDHKENEGSSWKAEHLDRDFVKCDESAETEKDVSEAGSSLMKLVLKVKHSGGQQPPGEAEKKDCNKENGIPKIVLTLRGKGPNKEYSCSNRLRNEDQSFSGENVNNKKHKSKKNKRQKLKEREKTRRALKGDKHKRHLELFGEDSNDSCDIVSDKANSYANRKWHSQDKPHDKQTPPLETVPSLDDSSLDHSDRESTSPPTKETLPAGSDKVEEESEEVRHVTKHSSFNESLSHSLPDTEPEVPESSAELGGTTGSVPREEEEVEEEGEKEEEVVEEQEKSGKDKQQEDLKELPAEAPKSHDSESPCSNLKSTEHTTAQAVLNVQSSTEKVCEKMNNQRDQSEVSTIRYRRDRHAKKTESGRNSDAYLWVSFGVGAPVLLPDMPNLELPPKSKERAEFREREAPGESKKQSPDEPSSEVTSRPSATNRKCKEDTGKAEVLPEKSWKPEERAKHPPAEQKDWQNKRSHSSCSSHSSDREGGEPAASRRRHPNAREHHRSRQSHRRSQKSVGGQEVKAKMEVDSSPSNTSKTVEKQDGASQESIDATPLDCTNHRHFASTTATDYATDLETGDVKTLIETKHDLVPTHKTSSTSSPTVDNTSIVEHHPDNTPQPPTIQNVTATDSAEETHNSKDVDQDDSFYYRPKKIRKLGSSNLRRVTSEERASPVDPPEARKPQVSEPSEGNHNSDRETNPVKVPLPLETVVAASPSGGSGTGSEASRVDCGSSEIETGQCWRPQDESGDSKVQHRQDTEPDSGVKNPRPLQRAPQDTETGLQEESMDESSQHNAEGAKEEAPEKQLPTARDCLLEKEENTKQEASKREREKRKRPRKDKRKDISGPGSKCSEDYFRREEAAGRLAQEFKRFNWLEEKIKNNSLCSSSPDASTPTTKEPDLSAKTPSTPSDPSTLPSSQFTFPPKKEEGHSRKNSFSGTSGGIGLKGHLQTAVPPLAPSSRVTALPKRRQSPTLPLTPPCSSSALYSATSVPSMTVQGALHTSESTRYRSEHGRVGPVLGKGSVDSGYEPSDSDKATLYSSTTSSKATLYGVKDNSFEALYNSVSTTPVNYYGKTDIPHNAATSPTICFYGSAKGQESGPHPSKLPPGSCSNPSINSPLVTGSITHRDHQQSTAGHSMPRHQDWPNSNLSASSDSSTVHQSSSNSSNPWSTKSVGSQKFSHKHTLLRRAFREMLKSEPDSPPEQEQEKLVVMHNSTTESEGEKINGSDVKENVTGSPPRLPSPVNATPKSVNSTSHASQPTDSSSTVSLAANKQSSETTEDNAPSSPSCTSVTMKSERDSPDSFCAEKVTSSQLSTKSEVVEKADCEAAPSNSSIGKKSNCKPEVKEEDASYSECSKSEDNIVNNEVTVVQEVTKTLKNEVMLSIKEASNDLDVKTLKAEVKPDCDNTEVQSSLLLSVLYKELMKTRQEVEKLRKVQELMLTEKGEKKEDNAEESKNESKEKEDKMDENGNDERISEKRKYPEESSGEEPGIDDEECQSHQVKRSKISIRNDLLPTDTTDALNSASSRTSLSPKSTSCMEQPSSLAPPLDSPVVSHSGSEVSVITLEGSTIPETSQVARNSYAVPTTSPEATNSILEQPRISPCLPKGPPLTSPGIPSSSPGVPRSSPGVPSSSPGVPRSSPGVPRSSPGVPRSSPGVPRSSPGAPSSSPGVPRSSPGVPRSSPGVLNTTGVLRSSPGALRTSPGVPSSSPGALGMNPGLQGTSPGLPRTNSGVLRTSPVISVISPEPKTGPGLSRNSPGVAMVTPGIPQSSPGVSQSNLIIPHTSPVLSESSHSLPNPSTAVLNSNVTQPKITTAQSVTSPITLFPRFSQNPVVSTAVPSASPTGTRASSLIPRTSPSTSVAHSVANISSSKADASLPDMSPRRLRSIFGISNLDVELMPIASGAKHPLPEPQPQTYLKLIDEHNQQIHESSLLMNAVKGIRRNSGSKDAEVPPRRAPMSFHHLIGSHEDPRRNLKTQPYEMYERKRHALSTSDLPDLPPSARKQPPPLKPVSALVRRHSDNLDVPSVIHHHHAYPGTLKNLANSLHSPVSGTEPKDANSIYSFSQPQCSPTQYPPTATAGRRKADDNCAERNREYHQAVSMGMQPQYPQHLPPNAPMMRSLGPDKATIFPVTPSMPTAILPFKPTTPPAGTRTQVEHFQNDNFYRSNFSFFERIREKCSQSCDNSAMDRGHPGQERLQPLTASMEKPLQPQTFVPRVLVRESHPETSAHMPTPQFSAPHYPNPNQHMPSVLTGHHGHFSSNMHSGSSIHHMPQPGLHPSTHQVTTSTQRRNSTGGGSNEKKQCFNCPQPARFLCSGCKKAWYCSEQCQRDHWAIHNAACVL